MNKFKALYINEMIKISRKLIVIIIMGLMVLGIFAYGGLMKISEISSTRYSSERINGKDDWVTEEMRYQLEDIENQISNLTDELSSDPENKNEILYQIKILEIQKGIYETAIEKEIYFYSNGYLAESLRSLMDTRVALLAYEDIPNEQLSDMQLEEIEKLEKNEKTYLNIVEGSDYELYMQLADELIKNDESLTEEEKQIKLGSNELRLKIDPEGQLGSGNDYDPLRSYLENIESIKRSLLHNIDYTSYNARPLTPAGRTKLENELAVQIYEIENIDLEKLEDNNMSYKELAISGMLSFGKFMLICMVLILAGGAISQEISTGSIKSLIIAPVRRYKIYFAKLASLVTAGIIAAAALYAVTVLAHGIFFGFGEGTGYIYAIGGQAKEMGFYLYRLSFIGVEFIDVLIYLVFAYMLSIITRNTAASVGISIAVYFGGNLVNLFLTNMELLTGEWIKFIPFNNMSLAARIFPDSQQMGIYGLLGLNLNMPTIVFSAIYIVVMLICLGYIGLDSFNRRDIK